MTFRFVFKLLDQYNIGGKFYSIIKSMYKNAKSCVMLSSGITESFRPGEGHQTRGHT